MAGDGLMPAAGAYDAHPTTGAHGAYPTTADALTKPSWVRAVSSGDREPDAREVDRHDGIATVAADAGTPRALVEARRSCSNLQRTLQEFRATGSLLPS